MKKRNHQKEEREPKRIKKLAIRVIWILVGVLAAVNAGISLSWLLILRSDMLTVSDEVLAEISSIGLFAVAVVSLLLFALIIHRVIVKRIKSLNSAVERVVKGDYDVNVPVKGSDEISNLTSNFNKMTAELKANEYLSREFSRSISHEFKTPLSVIRGYAEVIEGETEDLSLKESAQIIIQEADRLSDMSKSIMELSALDSTTLIKKEDIFSPASQICTILQASQILWEAKNITLELELEDFSVRSNEKLLYRVWQNLISNAIKFSPVGANLYITLKMSPVGFVFFVRDEGSGISEEDAPNIFTQFFVGDKSRNSEGNGLGLPLAKKIVERLGGHIAFKSKSGEGTQFTVRLIVPRKDINFFQS